MNGCAVGWTPSGLRSFSTAINRCAYRNKEFQYSNLPLCVLRTATVRSIIFINIRFVIVNTTTDFAPKEHYSAGPCEAVCGVKNKLFSAVLKELPNEC
jgi:hypothetical protein